MKSKAGHPVLILTPQNIPDGVFNGTWSGYIVEFVINDCMFRAVTYRGIRGRAKCKVVIEKGQITVETL